MKLMGNRASGWLPCVLLLSCLCPGAGAASGVSESQVKAVFLFNFAHFVAWPPDSFHRPDAPFVIGVLGSDPFGSTLDDVVRGEVIDQHPFVVRRVRDLGEAEDCNILYIGQTDPAQLDAVLQALKGHSVLTVSDSDGDQRHGVIIRMLTENNHVRLRIDVGAARADKLTISSNLLRSADIVGGADSGG
ncbi:MAG TPA: YfiR family protein [Steroidobacteraceae bacterium]|jgi:hypothetical protein